MTKWAADPLGEGFEQQTLTLSADALATLVRYSDRHHRLDRGDLAAGADVLYVHGWSDYFFQRELADFWHRAGAAFYALDLRNYGRSLRPGLAPGQTLSLSTYDEDISAALSAMGRTGNNDRPLILLGHSTGGLTLSLWAARNPGVASAIILNSPWLEFQANEFGRRVLTPFLVAGARRHPLAPLPQVDQGFYSRTISAAYGGEWDYNEEWRPPRGFPVTEAFLSAVLAGQATVERGLNIDCPVLVLLSDKSYLRPRWSEIASRSDVAIDVDIVAHRALSLGTTVTVTRVPDAIHDVFLSPPPVREKAYAAITSWLGGYRPTTRHISWVERTFDDLTF